MCFLSEVLPPVDDVRKGSEYHFEYKKYSPQVVCSKFIRTR